MQSLYPLKNKIMAYSWGSTTTIATLLGQRSPSDTPQAELWMGAHPKAPSMIKVNQQWVSLTDYIRQDPVGVLGETTVNRFGKQLPFLFKVLAADQPLSLQAHPDKGQAKEGFAKENLLNIPLGADVRNYRDENHKPECICALTPFWALNGFREPAEIFSLLRRACRRTLGPDIDGLKSKDDDIQLKQIFSLLMEMPPGHRIAVVTEALLYARSHMEADPIWEWVVKLAEFYPNDIGILSPAFLNLVCLLPNQAMYLPAGRLHAYLGGAGLELMANSDNVLRGGLTPKHVDVAELHRTLRFEPVRIEPILPRRIGACEEVYDTPAGEFCLSKISLTTGSGFQLEPGQGARIILCTQGDAVIENLGSGETVKIHKGASVFVTANGSGSLLTGEGLFFQAAVKPEDKR